MPTLHGKPEITNLMKANCIGEFSFEVETVCGVCATNGPDGACEVCAGAIEYVETQTVPWDTCKEIYKAMAVEASKSV